MDRQTIQAKMRTHMGRKTQELRNEAQIPAVVYGANAEPTNVSVDRVQFVKLYNKVRNAGLVDLTIEGGDTLPVIIQDFQQHPVQDTVTHADFLVVDLKKQVNAVITLVFTGESKAVKSLGGRLVTQYAEVPVRALPASLVPTIEVDVSVLETFDDAIRVLVLNIVIFLLRILVFPQLSMIDRQIYLHLYQNYKQL